MVVKLVRPDVLHDSLVLDLGPDKIHRLGGRCVPPLLCLDLLEGEPVPSFYDRFHQLMVVPKALKPELRELGFRVKLALRQNHFIQLLVHLNFYQCH